MTKSGREVYNKRSLISIPLKLKHKFKPILFNFFIYF